MFSYPDIGSLFCGPGHIVVASYLKNNKVDKACHNFAMYCGVWKTHFFGNSYFHSTACFMPSTFVVPVQGTRRSLNNNSSSLPIT